MLKRFLNPRWQHPDPQVRRQAVEALSPDEDAEAIAQVAREDALPALRRLALRRSLDLVLVAERAGQDDDSGVREQAARRYRELLAGLEDAGPPLAERLVIAAGSDDPALIEYLAREGKEDALRAQALARVERETVLRDVALDDASPELRLAALAGIQDEAILARVQERSRKSDKRVSHAARERLDALREARERPQKVAVESAQICDALDSLGRDGHWERDADRLDVLARRWQALDTELRAEFESRYSQARDRFAAALAAHRAAAGAARADKKAVIAHLEASSAPPGLDEQHDIEAWIAGREDALRDARAAWAASAALPEADERALEERLGEAETAVREAIATERQRVELERLLAGHQRLSARKGVIAESDVKALGRAIEELPRSESQPPALSALARRVDRAHRKLRERLRAQSGWKKDTLDTLSERLDALKAAVAEGRSSQAVAGYDALAADLDALLGAGTSAERLARERKRLASLEKEVSVMRAWDRFGARAALERLCEQVEALKGAEAPPPEIARQVREARASWKELARGGDGVAQALWRRFDTAATEAYRPCQAYFAEQAQARKANVERRRSLLRELEDFLASSRGGPETDWKAAVRFRRELLKRWHDAHPVERGAGKALAAEFDARMPVLDGLLERERTRSLRQREQIITEAEALAASDDKKAAAEACKRLQRQWQVTVPGSRKQENALWERFRTACDAVFGERQQVFDAERASIKAGIAEREALCQQVEALAGTAAPDLAEAELALNRLRGEWSRSATLPRREAETLEKRFDGALRRFQKHRRVLEARRRHDDLERLRSKAALCHEAECLPADGTASAGAVAALETRWESIGVLPDGEEDAALAARFQQALAAAANGAAPADPDALTENLAARESLCLRLEILAGVDSPPEHAAARMALQVERLASALGDRRQAGDDTAEALLRAWCTTGPAPRERAAGLEVRFEGAWRALGGGVPG